MKPRPVHATKGSDPNSRGKPASKGRSRASSADTARKPDPVQTVPSGRERHWEGIVGPEGADRADRYIAEVVGILSRSQIKARGATILLGGKPIKLSRPLPAGAQLRVEWVEEDSVHLVAEDIPLNVLYEDGNVIVVDKPQGMVTHPGHGNHRGTLANALAGRYGIAGGESAEAPGDPVRGFIVHRLDKDTSGVIIAARNTQAQEFLAGQFRDRLARKHYLAIVSGVLEPQEGRVENRLCRDKRERKRFCVSEGEGRLSVTEYRTLAVWNRSRAGETRSLSLVLLKPRTGRTHQLRVHMKYLGCPILGDPVYGRRDSGYPDISLMLHAWRLKIKVPDKNGAMIFMAPLPGRFRKMIAELGGLPPPRSRAGNQE